MNGTEMEIFVAPDGNDGGPGDRTTPFRTLARARDAIRELKRTACLIVPFTVWLRGGCYPLTELLLFTPEDSAPETFAACPGDFAQWQNLTDVEVVVLHFWIEELATTTFAVPRLTVKRDAEPGV